MDKSTAAEPAQGPPTNYAPTMLEAIKKIGYYLLATQGFGLILHPTEESFECWVDASHHAGEWKHIGAMMDTMMAKSRTGYLIMYAGCPILWASKLQTEIK